MNCFYVADSFFILFFILHSNDFVWYSFDDLQIIIIFIIIFKRKS